MTWVAAGRVRTGDRLWNPYGGRAGAFTAQSEPRPAGDDVEILTDRGSVARFKPGFLLYRDEPQRDATEIEAGQ